MAKQKRAIFYLTDESLIVQTEREIIKKIAFDQEILSDQKKLLDFLSENLVFIGQKVNVGIIVLGSGMLYQTVAKKGEDIQKVIEELATSSPFRKRDIQIKSIKTGNKTYILATNRTIYETLLSACEQSAVTIEAVVPLSLFSDTKDKTPLGKKDSKAILQTKKLYTIGNFLESADEGMRTSIVSSPINSSLREGFVEEAGESEKASSVVASPKPISTEEEQKDVSSTLPETLSYTKEVVWNIPRLLFILGLLIVLTVVMGYLIYTQQVREDRAFVAEITNPTLTNTPTPSPRTVAKDELTIRIENGTGIPGQAAKVKNLLLDKEFTNIQIGNADSSDHRKTTVVFSERVSSKDQQELKDVLLRTFTAVITQTATKQNVDILIITGEEK